MKKTIFALLLVVALVAVLAIPAAAAEAAPGTYCVCGDATCTKTTEGHGTMVEWKAWNETGTLPDEGYYYLTKNVTLTTKKLINTAVTLGINLNGKTINAAASGVEFIFEVNNASATLIIADSSSPSTGKIDFKNCTSAHAPGLFQQTGTIKLYGGTITQTGSKIAGSGGAGLTQKAGNFYMYGGAFRNCVASDANNSNGGGNIQIRSGATFYMYDGTIADGSVVDKNANNTNKGGNVSMIGGTFHMYGGTISGGTALQGASINLSGTSSFNIYEGATIRGVTAGTSGAICTWNSATLNMSGGQITSNSIGYKGGAVLLNDSTVMTMTGGSITGNTAPATSGAVHVQGTATLKVSGTAQITGNNGNNVYLSNNTAITIGEGGIGTANVGVTMQTPGVFVKDGATSVAGFVPDNNNYRVTYEAGKLSLTEKVNIFLVDGVQKTWAEAQASGKLITLGSDIGEITVSQNVALDFAGYTVEELRINGNQFVKVADTVTGKVLAKTGAGVLVSSNPDKSLTLAQDGSLTFTAAPVFKVGDNDPVVWSEAKTADRVTMVGDLYAHIVVDKENQVIDLAGNNLGAVLTTVGDRETNEGYLKIIDSETNDYDADGNGYGIVFARDGSGMRFYGEGIDTWVDTTGYKYIRVFDGAEGQSFHRVYFAVTHSVLQMKESTVDPYMQYKTNLKCTPKLAALINNDANIKYGFAVTLSGKTAIGFYDTANNPVTGGGVDNVRITAVTFNAEDITGKEQTYLESDLGAQAVIRINGGEQKSVMRSRSVMAMVQSVMANQWPTWTDETTAAKKDIMKAFYTKYEAVMSNWDKIDDLKN